jgi:5-methylcytosine-specific restriction protein B
MTNEQLALELRKACESAPPGERVVTIHLFGIRFANELKRRNLKQIAGLAGIPETYGTELAKGAKLAPHVTVK